MYLQWPEHDAIRQKKKGTYKVLEISSFIFFSQEVLIFLSYIISMKIVKAVLKSAHNHVSIKKKS